MRVVSTLGGEPEADQPDFIAHFGNFRQSDFANREHQRHRIGD